MDPGSHLRKLREISEEEVRSVPMTEFHRYYWMDVKQVPESLRCSDNVKDGRLQSDYGLACDSTTTYWEDYKRGAYLEDKKFINRCKSFAKRDTLSKFFIDLKFPLKSEYDAATEFNQEKAQTTVDCDKQFHLKSNPITVFAQAFRAQKNVMRS